MFKSKTGMYMYISTIVFLALILVFFTVYALVSGSTSQTAENNKTEISVFTSVGDYTEKYTQLNEAAGEYMDSHPDISVKCSTLPEEEFNIKLQTDVASGRCPDIIITYPTATMKTLFDRGLIADLTEEFENDRAWYDSFDKSVLQLCTSDERIFASPMETEYIVLFANKKILKQNGLALPKTYDELKNCVSVLSANSVTPFAFGLKDENLFLYQALIAGCGGSRAIETAVNSRTFSSAYTDAMNLLKELFNMGAFSNGFETLSRAEVQKMFINEKAAFIAESSSFAGEIENSINSSDAAETFEVLAMPCPGAYYTSQTESERNFYPLIYGAGDMTVFVSPAAYRTKHDAVTDYVKYLTSSGVKSKFVSRAKYISALKSYDTPVKNGPLITQCNILTLSSAEFTLTPSNVTDRLIWGHTFSSSTAAVLRGEASPEDIISQAESLCQISSPKGGDNR